MLDVQKLVQVCSIREYGSQDIIFEQGDSGSEMFIILSGAVRVLITVHNGNKVEIARLKAGDIFGEMSLLEGLQRSATVQVLEETTIAAVNESNFESVICQEPSLSLRIMKILSERIRRQTVELTKYMDQFNLNQQPLAPDPLPKIVEIKEKHEPEDSQEEFSKLMLYIRKFDKVTPSNHAAYLFEKEITCPVCDQTINVKHFQSSELSIKQIESDYRQVYTDFDPLWYIVWVCPNCYYANFSTDFLNISNREREQIKGLSSAAKDTFGCLPTGPLSLTQVLTGYYLTLYWFQRLKTPAQDYEKLGKLWLRLSWLYQDVQEGEMSIAATRKALEYFLNRLSDIKLKLFSSVYYPQRWK